MNTPEKTKPCPICKKKVENKDNPSFPFCSERCKLLDLSKWLDGDYFIEGSDSATEPGNGD